MKRSGLFGAVIALVAALLLASAAPPAIAQEAGAATALPDPLTPDAINALVSKLSDEQVRSLLLEELGARAAASPAEAEKPAEPAMSARVTEIARAVVARIFSNVVNSGGNFGQTISSLSGYVGSLGFTGALHLFGVIALAVAAGLGADRLYHRIILRRRGELTETPHAPDAPAFPASIPYLARRLLREAGGVILFFIVAAAILVFALPEREASLGLVVAMWLILFPKLGAIVLRFFLSPDRPDLRLVHTDDWSASYLYRNLHGVIIVVGIAVTLLRFLEIIGVEAVNIRAGFWLNLLVFVWLGVIFVRAREGLKNIIRGGQPTHSWMESRVVAAYPAFAVGAIALTWLAGTTAAVMGNLELLRGARHLISLVILLLAPMCDTLIRSVVHLLVPPMRGTGAQAQAAYNALSRSYIRIARVLVFGAIVILTASLWDITLFSMASAGVGEDYARHVVEALLILAAGYIAWELTRLLINRKLSSQRADGASGPPEDLGDDAGSGGAGSRLGTILPPLSWAIQTVIIILTILMALGHIGINVTPLLAGAGVAGIAIGFGAQKLVADVVSGVFFLIDDAFRVNEYIDAGGVQGTVEKIALRSIQLRQSDGPINVIPYSNIKSITNFGRDWGVFKLKFTVPFDTDIEKVRKIFKKIGQEMAENPEFKDAFLVPFKSQGVREFTDHGIVVRGKFMFRPELAKQFTIRRDIFKRIQEEFAKAGIEFARREVRVSVDTHGAPLSEADTQRIGAAAAEAAEPEVPEVPAKTKK